MSPAWRQSIGTPPSRARSPLRRLALLLAFWATVGLAPSAIADGGGRLVVSDMVMEAGERRSVFTARIDLELAEPVVEALRNGVPITFRWELALTEPGLLGLGRRLWETGGRLRLAYRPLSRRYSLADEIGGTERSFPDLPRLLEAVGELNQSLPPLAPVVAAGEAVAVRFRIRLEITALPPALRLPSYLDDAWRMDSGWVTRAANITEPPAVDGESPADAR